MTITVEEIHRRAARFERRIRWRNAREYGAGAVVIALFCLQAWHQRGWPGMPAWLLIAGTIYVMVQLHRRGSARSLPPDAGFAASLKSHRQELERQRDALRAVWSWYLLPFAPGLAAALIMAAVEHRINLVWYICCAAFPAGFAGIWKLNQSAAQRLDRKIQELRSMEEDE